MGELQVAICRMAWRWEWSAQDLLTALAESYSDEQGWRDTIAGDIEKFGAAPFLPGEDGFVGESDGG